MGSGHLLLDISIEFLADWGHDCGGGAREGLPMNNLRADWNPGDERFWNPEVASVVVSDDIDRLVICSDLHAYREPLEVLDQHFQDQPIASQVLVNGDILEGGLDAIETVAWVQKHASGYTTRGNHDSGIFRYLRDGPSGVTSLGADTEMAAYMVLEEGAMEFLEGLPDVLDVRWKGFQLRLMHGHFSLQTRAYTDWRLGRDAIVELFADATVDLMVVGHTHYPFVAIGSFGSVANPGSLAAPIYRFTQLDGQQIDRRREDPDIADGVVRSSYLVVDVVDGVLDPRLVMFQFDQERLLRRYDARDDLRMAPLFRRRWITQGHNDPSLSSG